MHKQVPFEDWLRVSLACKAQEIEPAADLWECVKSTILTMEKEKRIMFGEKLGNYLFFWQPAWKKTMAIALCGLLLVGGPALGISPQARAWATDAFGFIVFKVIRTGDGYSLVKLSSEQAVPEEGVSFGFGKIEKAGEIPAKAPGGIKGIKVKAGHMLKWENEGLAYTLRDNGDLSFGEMVMIAE
ncbi:MAG: hypothetical protein AB1510_04275 [Bacillota bacterium]